MRNTIELRLSILRKLRDIKLKESDVQLLILNESGGDATELKAYRQSLRNLTEPYKAILEGESIDLDEDIFELATEWNVLDII